MKNRILYFFTSLMFVILTLPSCLEVDEPVNIIVPPASIVFNNNPLSDGGSFRFSESTISFQLKVTDGSGTVTSVAIANRYTITGNSLVKVNPLGEVNLTNGIATITIPISSLRLSEDPVLTFANRGNNSIRVTVNTSTGNTVRFFNVNILNT